MSPTPRTQQAILLGVPDNANNTNGQLEFFFHPQIEVESPGTGEIQIRIMSAALNPVDWKTRRDDKDVDGMRFMISDGYPAVLGTDIAGEVVGLGEGVRDFAMGDRVFCQSEFKKKRGGFQQYVVAHASRVAKIPANVTYDGAATLPMALTTAYSGMFSALPTGLGLDPSSILSIPGNASQRKIYENTPILVLGGSTSVGQFVLQLARLAGFSTIITTASLRHASALMDLGATHVLDRSLSSEETKAAISKITASPISLVYDSVSTNETQRTALACLTAERGRVVLVQPQVPQDGVTGQGEVEVAMAIAAVHFPHNVGLLERFYHDIVYGLLEIGALVSNRTEVLPNGLGGIVEGLKRLEADQISRLKLVARPQETIMTGPTS